MSKLTATQEDWSGIKFANGWVIDKKINCAEYRKIYTELTGETTINKNTHYLCHNENCGIETYIERTVIKRALDNGTPCMTKCRGCVDGAKAGFCHYSTMARVKPLTKVPDRSPKVEVGKIYGNFKVLSIRSSEVYSDHQCRAEVQCIHCGEIQERRFDTLLNGTISCDCFRNHSSGEMYIESYLIDHGLDYRSEYTFNDLYGTDGGKLRYDFAVMSNNIPIALIEFDGEQHFKSVEHWGGAVQLEKQQNHDYIKDEYAKKHNIPLIRIPYSEILNTYKLLDNFLDI